MSDEQRIRDLIDRMNGLAAALRASNSRIADTDKQMARFQAILESEGGNKKRLIEELQRELKVVEMWKSQMEGAWVVLKVIIGIMCGVIVGVIIWLLTIK